MNANMNSIGSVIPATATAAAAARYTEAFLVLFSLGIAYHIANAPAGKINVEVYTCPTLNLAGTVCAIDIKFSLRSSAPAAMISDSVSVPSAASATICASLTPHCASQTDSSALFVASLTI